MSDYISDEESNEYDDEDEDEDENVSESARRAQRRGDNVDGPSLHAQEAAARNRKFREKVVKVSMTSPHHGNNNDDK